MNFFFQTMLELNEILRYVEAKWGNINEDYGKCKEHNLPYKYVLADCFFCAKCDWVKHWAVKPFDLDIDKKAAEEKFRNGIFDLVTSKNMPVNFFLAY